MNFYKVLFLWKVLRVLYSLLESFSIQGNLETSSQHEKLGIDKRCNYLWTWYEHKGLVFDFWCYCNVSASFATPLECSELSFQLQNRKSWERCSPNSCTQSMFTLEQGLLHAWSCKYPSSTLCSGLNHKSELILNHLMVIWSGIWLGAQPISMACWYSLKK